MRNENGENDMNRSWKRRPKKIWKRKKGSPFKFMLRGGYRAPRGDFGTGITQHNIPMSEMILNNLFLSGFLKRRDPNAQSS